MDKNNKLYSLRLKVHCTSVGPWVAVDLWLEDWVACLEGGKSGEGWTTQEIAGHCSVEFGWN